MLRPLMLSLLLVLAPAGAQTIAPPPNQPPSPEVPPAAPDPAAVPAEEVDCSGKIDTSKMKADERKRLKEVCAKAPRKTPVPDRSEAPSSG
jgi:hypothetical protein